MNEDDGLGLLERAFANWETLLSLPQSFEDPVEQVAKDNKAQSTLKGLGEPDAEVFKKLCHIKANPSVKSISEAIKSTYVFSQQGSRNGNRPINGSLEDASAFVDELIVAARQENVAARKRQEALATSGFSPRLFVVRGERGCGKTFFLNYVISKFGEEFNRNKILWVRLDLTKTNWLDTDKSAHNNGSTVLDWLLAQATKILFRYYNSKSTHWTDYPGSRFDVRKLGVFAFLDSYISRIDNAVDATRLRANLRIMRNTFEGQALDRDINLNLVDRELAQQIQKWLVDQEIGMVFVIDGFDPLDISSVVKQQFAGLAASVQQLAGTAEDLGMVLVAVMRKNTYEKQGAVSPFRNERVKLFDVVSHKFDEIISKRFDFIKGMIQSNSIRWAEHSPEKLLANIIDFEHSLSEGTPSEVEQISSYNADNIREKMQAVQLKYAAFIQDLTGGKFYRILETVLKCGLEFIPKHFDYVFSGTDVLRLRHDVVTTDNRFFPSIFSYPFLKKDQHSDSSELEHTSGDLLAWLRVAQIVNATERGLAASKIKSRSTLAQIENVLHFMFGYDKRLIGLIVEEGMEFGMWKQAQEAIPQYVNNGDVRIIEMSKNRFLLSTLISEMTYLGMAFMRAPILVRPIAGKSEFVHVQSYGGPAQGPHSLERWIAAKLLNSISAFRIMSSINRDQMENLKSRLSSIEGISQGEKLIFENFLRSKPFDFLKYVRESLSKEINSSLNAKLSTGKRPLETHSISGAFANYMKDWG